MCSVVESLVEGIDLSWVGLFHILATNFSTINEEIEMHTILGDYTYMRANFGNETTFDQAWQV